MSTHLPQIPRDVIGSFILPAAASEFLLVDKQFYLQALEVLIEGCPDVTTLLVRYIERNNLLALKTILQIKKVDPSADENQAIRKAIEADFLEAIEILINDPRFDPNKMPWGYNYMTTIISFCIEYGSVQALDLLLVCPLLDPSENYNRAVCAAVYCNDIQKLQRLMADPRVDPSIPIDFDPYLPGPPGIRHNQAIKIAAENGYLEMTKLLIQDPRVDPSDGLACAVENLQQETVDLLLADGRAKLKDWYIEYARSRGADRITQALVAYETHVNNNNK